MRELDRLVNIMGLNIIQSNDLLHFKKYVYSFNLLSGITNLFIMLSEVTKMFAELMSFFKFIFIFIENYLYYFYGKTSCKKPSNFGPNHGRSDTNGRME
jgi:hypothetical protein